MTDHTSYTTSQAARILGVSPQTLRRYITSGQLPEPGWGRMGLKKQREFTQEWIDAAQQWMKAS